METELLKKFRAAAAMWLEFCKNPERFVISRGEQSLKIKSKKGPKPYLNHGSEEVQNDC